MAASTIPAAKAALLAALQARPALAAAHVARGIPAKPAARKERVYIGNARDVQRTWAGLGGQRLDETYVLDLVIECFRSGDDQAGTEVRLWELVNEIELTVRADLTLAGTVRSCRPDGSTEETGPDEGGWLARAVTRLAVEARI